ncbi:hypothetical protein E4T66_17325 [Sinimarinibacterium sp. CAU 1509]|uniref:hypothetical protein n=1 Tax=Sinimarinibacterium sp. CAU 1509 TaxID=2562283 RepID=UPI0010AB9EF8|nr:hypothetical protein [Sinimarinibacterium sp. CAU 1509]TJY57172.1 hypothetical protein E4T66_17325 [Sinimarinibacterium sp. CAU 1509]
MFEADRLPARDSRGALWHPDTPDIPYGSSFPAAFAALGYECRYVDLADDWDAGEVHHRFKAGEPESALLAQWHPTRPNGQGWALAGIWACEIGPTSLWVRPHRSGLISRIKAQWAFRSNVEAATRPESRLPPQQRGRSGAVG